MSDPTPPFGRLRQSLEGHQLNGDFRYRTRESWPRARRVVAKAEYLAKGENPRFVVTSLTAEQAPGATALRDDLLRAGRDGEPHQGAAVGAVRRPHLDGAIAVESDPLIFFIDRLLRAGSAAAAGAGGDEDGAGASGNDPAEAVEDRGADSDHGAQGVDFAGDGIPLGGRVLTSV